MSITPSLPTDVQGGFCGDISGTVPVSSRKLPPKLLASDYHFLYMVGGYMLIRQFSAGIDLG